MPPRRKSFAQWPNTGRPNVGHASQISNTRWMAVVGAQRRKPRIINSRIPIDCPTNPVVSLEPRFNHGHPVAIWSLSLPTLVVRTLVMRAVARPPFTRTPWSPGFKHPNAPLITWSVMATLPSRSAVTSGANRTLELPTTAVRTLFAREGDQQPR